MEFPVSHYAKKIVNMVKSKKYVELLPNISNKRAYEILGNCDVFLTVSFEIGLMMAQLEALATGTPIVGFVNSVAEEVVVEGCNGYLGVNLYDLAKKCLIALDLNRLTCRKFVENNFSEQKMYERYMRLYKDVIENIQKKTKNNLFQ